MRLLCTALLSTLLLAATAHADDHVVVHHQGRLVDANDRPIGGEQALVFSLYDVEAGGSAFWTSDFRVTPVNGLYDVDLVLSPDDARRAKWLGIKVNGTDLSPRLRLGMVPVSLRALDADQLAGRPAEEYARVDGTVASAGDAAKLGGVDAVEYARKTDVAPDAASLGGRPAQEYALKSDTASNAARLGGLFAEEYALRNGSIADADNLGGRPASQFALKSDTVANASALGGVPSSLLLDEGGLIRLTALRTGTSGLAVLDENGRLPMTALRLGANGLALLDENGKLPPSALPGAVATLGTNGRLPATALPADVAYLSGGRLAPSQLPAEVAYTTNGRLSTAQLPTDVALLTGGRITGAQLPTNAAILDENGRLPVANLPTSLVTFDATGRLPVANLPTSAAVLDANGRLGASALPTTAVLVDNNGKVAEAVLPASVPLLNAAGKLPASTIPGGAGAAALLDADGKLTKAMLPAGVVTTDAAGKIPASTLPASLSSYAESHTGLANGACVDLEHNFGTRALQYTVWMTEGTRWVPMGAVSRRDGVTNIAAGKTATHSTYHTSSTIYVAASAVDGSLSTHWHSNTGDGQGFITIDLGVVTTIDRVRAAGHSYTTGWEVLVSTDGTSFGLPVATGSCSVGGSCGGFVETTFSPVSARYVRFRDISGDPTYSLFSEVEVYGATYPVTQTDVNTMRFCNYTGATRDFEILISR